LAVENIGGNTGYARYRSVPRGRHHAILSNPQHDHIAGLRRAQPGLAAQPYQLFGVADIATLFEVRAHDAVQKLSLQAAPGRMCDQQM